MPNRIFCKPLNLLYTTPNKSAIIKITDFGLVRENNVNAMRAPAFIGLFN